MLRKGAGASSGRCRAAGWCPISVRRCTIGVNAKLPWCLSLFKIHSSSDAPRNEFAGGERGDNRGTKCPDPKALLDGIQQRFFICVHGFPRWCTGARDHPVARLHSHRLSSALRAVPSFFSCSGCSFADSAPLRACCPGLPGWRARNASVTLSFRRPRGRENGRQFSYKQNAEEGVRLDEQRRTMVRGRRGGGCRSFVVGKGAARPGFPELFHGLYARSGAIAGRCVRIHTRCLMSRRLSDVSPLVHPVASGRIGVRSRYRCARIDLPPDPAFLRLLHRDDIAVAHRDGRTTVPAGMRRMGAAFHGKTSMGAAGLDN